jgi:lipopolysaccharide/colanic/teichoic acid biosynthesis glycosyltransferase
MLKRLLDFIFALLGLLVLSLPLLVTALIVRAKLGAPVLFRQQRPGRDGRPFELLKFRTMTAARDAAGELLPDHERLTPFGRALRRSSVDELPELWNVVKGEMSLVGPRPLLMEYLPLYSAEQARRHAVRPGITGWSQVNGRNITDWETRLAQDVWYVDNHTLGLDLKILLRTVGTVLGAKGVQQAGRATRDRFTGSQTADSDRDPGI